MTDPLGATFVRSVRPKSDEWFKTAQDRLRVQSGDAQAFARFRAVLAEGRGHSSSTLTARSEEPWTGTLPVRSVEPVGLRNLTWDTRPAVVSGSADRAATVSGRSLSWDVTADYAAALAAGEDLVEFRFSASSATAQWLTRASLELTTVTYALAVSPTSVAPVGVVGSLKPVFTWDAPRDITNVTVQVQAAGGDWSAPVYNSGSLTSTAARVDTATQGSAWSGLSGAMQARVRHFTAAAGWSGWATVSLSYSAPTSFTVSNPGATSADNSPPDTWTPAAQAVEIISYLDGVRIGTTGLLPGPISSYTPAEKAKRAGQVLRRERHFYDGAERVQPAFTKVVTDTTFTPSASVAPLTSLVVTQVDASPAVQVAVTRVVAGVSDLPDEVATYIDGDAGAKFDGTDTYTDWTVPPNKDVVYSGRAVVNGDQSNGEYLYALRTKVGGAWLVDPVTGRGFVVSGTDGLEVAYGGEVVVHTPIDGATLLRRTLTRRGPEGSIVGNLDATGNLPSLWTPEEELANVEWLAERPGRVLRLVLGDLNVPVVCSSLQVVPDFGLMRTHQVWHRVSFAFSHAGDD